MATQNNNSTEGLNIEKVVFEPLPFKILGNISRTTSKELSETIKAYFSEIFNDLAGVLIEYNFQRQVFETKFFFEKNANPDPNKISSVVKTDDYNDSKIPANSYLVGMKKMRNRADGRFMTLNEDTRKILSRFMFGGENANMPNNKKVWDNKIDGAIKVIPTNDNTYLPFNNDFHRIIIEVRKLDLHAILGVLYGNTMITVSKKNNDSESEILTTHNARYNVHFIKYIAQPYYFVMHIEQFDRDAVEEFTMKENPAMYTAPNGIFFY